MTFFGQCPLFRHRNELMCRSSLLLMFSTNYLLCSIFFAFVSDETNN